MQTFSLPQSSLTSPISRPQQSTTVRYTAEEALNHVINIEDNDCEYESVFNDVEEVENCGDQNGTLWMSCSPGRDSEDDLQCLDDVDVSL